MAAHISEPKNAAIIYTSLIILGFVGSPPFSTDGIKFGSPFLEPIKTANSIMTNARITNCINAGIIPSMIPAFTLKGLFLLKN